MQFHWFYFPENLVYLTNDSTEFIRLKIKYRPFRKGYKTSIKSARPDFRMCIENRSNTTTKSLQWGGKESNPSSCTDALCTLFSVPNTSELFGWLMWCACDCTLCVHCGNFKRFALLGDSNAEKRVSPFHDNKGKNKNKNEQKKKCDRRSLATKTAIHPKWNKCSIQNLQQFYKETHF